MTIESDQGVDDMYRIGEFSRIVSMSVKTLRYYDEIKLLSPAFVNEENNYRFYNDTSYEKALWIQTMKKYNFSIKEIQEVLPNINSDDDLADFLLEKKEHIHTQILSMKQLQKNLEVEVSRLKEDKSMNQNQKVEVLEIKDMLIASIRYEGKYEDVGIYIGQLYKNVGGKAMNEPFSLYYDEEYTEQNADVEVCIEVKAPLQKKDIKTRQLKGGRFVSIIHIGSYDTLSRSYKAIADYMKENHLESKAPSREIYLKGPGMLFKGNPDKYETQIMFQV